MRCCVSLGTEKEEDSNLENYPSGLEFGCFSIFGSKAGLDF